MNTTPKPNATKKSNGELGPPPPALAPVVVAAAADDAAVDVGMAVVDAAVVRSDMVVYEFQTLRNLDRIGRADQASSSVDRYQTAGIDTGTTSRYHQRTSTPCRYISGAWGDERPRSWKVRNVVVHRP